jgi:hypothetical protein
MKISTARQSMPRRRHLGEMKPAQPIRATAILETRYWSLGLLEKIPLSLHFLVASSSKIELGTSRQFCDGLSVLQIIDELISLVVP